MTLKVKFDVSRITRIEYIRKYFNSSIDFSKPIKSFYSIVLENIAKNSLKNMLVFLPIPSRNS